MRERSREKTIYSVKEQAECRVRKELYRLYQDYLQGILTSFGLTPKAVKEIQKQKNNISVVYDLEEPRIVGDVLELPLGIRRLIEGIMPGIPLRLNEVRTDFVGMFLKFVPEKPSERNMTSNDLLLLADGTRVEPILCFNMLEAKGDYLKIAPQPPVGAQRTYFPLGKNLMADTLRIMRDLTQLRLTNPVVRSSVSIEAEKSATQLG